MNAKQLHVLQHSLWLDQYGRGTHYRNRFITGPGSKDFGHCQALVQAGLMQDHGVRELAGGDHLFTVTEAGRMAVREQSPPAPKLSRGRQRYLEFLSSDCGEGFGIWLRRHYGKAAV